MIKYTQSMRSYWVPLLTLCDSFSGYWSMHSTGGLWWIQYFHVWYCLPHFGHLYRAI